MSQDEFTKLFKYIQEFRGDVDKRFNDMESDIREVKLAVGELAGQI